MPNSALNLIDNTITALISKGNRSEELLNIIQSQDHDVVLNRIVLAFQKLNADRRRHRRNQDLLDMAEETVVGKKGSKTIAPERIFGLLQMISNKMCWVVRARIIDIRAQAKEDALSGSSGVDFTEASAELNGIDPSEDIESLITTLIEAGDYLKNVHSFLQSLVSDYMPDLEPLALYLDRAPTGEVNEDGYDIWEVVFQSESYDEIAGYMEDAIARLAEEDEAKSMEQASNIDFTGKAAA